MSVRPSPLPSVRPPSASKVQAAYLTERSLITERRRRLPCGASAVWIGTLNSNLLRRPSDVVWQRRDKKLRSPKSSYSRRLWPPLRIRTNQQEKKLVRLPRVPPIDDNEGSWLCQQLRANFPTIELFRLCPITFPSFRSTSRHLRAMPRNLTHTLLQLATRLGMQTSPL